MLDEEQAAIVKGCLGRGDKQQDIAAYFGENPGRIAELSVGYVVTKGKKIPHRFRDVKAAPKHLLPSRAQMVPWGFIMEEARRAIRIAEMGLASARARLDEIEERLQEAATKAVPKGRRN